jgi:hypothetical protein
MDPKFPAQWCRKDLTDKRPLLERAVLSDPEPDCFEAWLLERCLSVEATSIGPMRATALEVPSEWSLTAVSAQLRELAHRRGPVGGPDTVMMPAVPDRAGAATLLRCLAGNM